MVEGECFFLLLNGVELFWPGVNANFLKKAEKCRDEAGDMQASPASILPGTYVGIGSAVISLYLRKRESGSMVEWILRVAK